MKYYRAGLGGIDYWMLSYNGTLEEHQLQWMQQPDHWTMFFLEHSGGFVVNNRTTAFTDGSLALVAPGTKVGFLRVGEGTQHYALTFGLLARKDTVALPSLCHLGELKEVRRAEFARAYAWLHKSVGPGLACAYNVLWSIAEPVTVLRSTDLMYDFERLVTQRLGEKLSVSQLASELGISPSQMLRSVRAEYNVTVQQFIREKRSEIAKTLLITTDLPIKTIASKTGMNDLHYFNKAVRAVSGLSPRALRELATNKSLH